MWIRLFYLSACLLSTVMRQVHRTLGYRCLSPALSFLRFVLLQLGVLYKRQRAPSLLQESSLVLEEWIHGRPGALSYKSCLSCVVGYTGRTQIVVRNVLTGWWPEHFRDGVRSMVIVARLGFPMDVQSLLASAWPKSNLSPIHERCVSSSSVFTCCARF